MKVIIEIEVSNEKFIDLANYLTAMSGAEIKSAAPKAETSTQEKAPAKKAPAKEEKPDSVTKSDLQNLVIKHRKEHKAAIKAKLEELGAASVSTLPEEDYPEFFTFLESL